MTAQMSLLTGDTTTVPGLVYMLDSDPVPDDHPTEWLRGRQLVGIAVTEIGGLPIKAPVEIVSYDEVLALRTQLDEAQAKIAELEARM